MSNPIPTAGGFGQFVPGFEFLQNLVQPAPAASAAMPNLGGWVAPTLNVEDLEKRIEEPKAVHFWLDQNSKALGATIQAMEVQKMTLATLRDMNVNFGDLSKMGSAAVDSVSKTFAGMQTPAAPETEAKTEPQAKPSEPERKGRQKSKPATAPKQEQIDPMQWWGALQQQFQNIAVNAMQDLSKQEAPAGARGKAGAAKAPAKTAPAKKKAPARKKSSGSGRAR